MDYLTIKELVLEIVQEILSSEENLQELWVTKRRKGVVPKKKRQRPQIVDRHKYASPPFKPFAGIGGLQIGAAFVRRGGPQDNPSASSVVRPPRR